MGWGCFVNSEICIHSEVTYFWFNTTQLCYSSVLSGLQDIPHAPRVVTLERSYRGSKSPSAEKVSDKTLRRRRYGWAVSLLAILVII